MKLPMFARRRWAVRLDPNYYRSDHGPLVFQSGPFIDKFFWRESAARRYLADHLNEMPVLYRLGWRPA